MPEAHVKEILKKAKANGFCIPAINIWNLETFEGIVEASEEISAPIIIPVYGPGFTGRRLKAITDYIKAIAEESNCELALHLDHCQDIEQIKQALKLGFSALMFDGSLDYTFDKRIKQTKIVSELVHEKGCFLEAEVGHIPRVGVDEHDVKEKIVNIEMAIKFIEETKIDIVAPAVGTIHGLVDKKAEINYELINEIKKVTNSFLSIHGGTGVSIEDIKKLVNHGVVKMSFATMVFNLSAKRIKDLAEKKPQDYNFMNLTNEIRLAFKEETHRLLKLLSEH